MTNTECFDSETLFRTIEQKNKELKELRNTISGQLEKDLKSSSNLDKMTLHEINFFLSLGDADVDLNFIAFCICDNAFLEDYYTFRCKNTFTPHIIRFNILIQSLRKIYADC